jgi:hypothetical protein
MSHQAPIVEQFRYTRFNAEDYNRDVALMTQVDEAPCITFNQFRILAKRHGWTVDSLADHVRGAIEEPKQTMERILKTGPADTVIPYTCLIQLYEKATAIPEARPGEQSCACGCGGRVRGKQRFATSACQRRAHRQRQVA